MKVQGTKSNFQNRKSFNLSQRESVLSELQLHVPTFRSLPHVEHKPLHASSHSTCPGNASRISSLTRSSSSIPSPSNTARFKSSCCNSCCSSSFHETAGVNLSANSTWTGNSTDFKHRPHGIATRVNNF